MMREKLIEIIYWKPGDEGVTPLARDKVEAAKNVVMLDLAILNVEAAAGMYKKPIDVLAKEILWEPLPPKFVLRSLRPGSAVGWLLRRLLNRIVSSSLRKNHEIEPSFCPVRLGGCGMMCPIGVWRMMRD